MASLKSFVRQFENDANRVSEWASADENTSVDMGGGPVRSPAKLIKDNDIRINETGLLAQVNDAADRAEQSAIDAADLGGLTTGSNLSPVAEDTPVPSVENIVPGSTDPLNAQAQALFNRQEKYKSDISSTSGSGLVGWIRSALGAVATNVNKWIARQNGSLYDFMTDAEIEDSQRPIPLMDHTDAIFKWLATGTSRNALYLPAGEFRFNLALVAPVVTHLKIYGEGRRKSVLRYFGPSTSIDLLTVGDGETPIKPFLSGFSVESDTTMTDGVAIRLKKCVNGFSVRDVSPGTPAGTYKLWHGIRFDNINVGSYTEFEIGVQGDGIVVNGKAGTDEGSDLFIDKGLILAGTNQIHMAGGFGGLTIGQVLCYGGKVNILIDQSLVPRLNREVLLSSRCVLDAASEALIRINDDGGQLWVNCDAWLSGGGFFTPDPGYGIDVVSMNGGHLLIGSGAIKGCTSHGINIQDPTANIYVSDKTLIGYNGGWNVYSDQYTQNAKINANFAASTLGNISGFVDSYMQTGLSISATFGSITSYSGLTRYQLTGGVCDVYSEAIITDNGSGNGALIFYAPFPIKKPVVGCGYCSGISGKSVYARGESGGNAITVSNYDGTYPASNGETVRVRYSFEVQF